MIVEVLYSSISRLSEDDEKGINEAIKFLLESNEPIINDNKECLDNYFGEIKAEIDIDALYKLIGNDINKLPDSYEFQFVESVQSRKHKKKRINKKYIKKYGYKEVVVNKMKGLHLRQNTDKTFEFILENKEG